MYTNGPVKVMPITSKGRLTMYWEYITQNNEKAYNPNTTESQMLIQSSLYGRRRAKRRDTTVKPEITIIQKYTFTVNTKTKGIVMTRRMTYNPAKYRCSNPDRCQQMHTVDAISHYSSQDSSQRFWLDTATELGGGLQRYTTQ